MCIYFVTKRYHFNLLVPLAARPCSTPFVGRTETAKISISLHWINDFHAALDSIRYDNVRHFLVLSAATSAAREGTRKKKKRNNEQQRTELKLFSIERFGIRWTRNNIVLPLQCPTINCKVCLQLFVTVVVIDGLYAPELDTNVDISFNWFRIESSKMKIELNENERIFGISMPNSVIIFSIRIFVTCMCICTINVLVFHAIVYVCACFQPIYAFHDAFYSWRLATGEPMDSSFKTLCEWCGYIIIINN